MKRGRSILLVAMLFVLGASRSDAADVHLAWDECGTSGSYMRLFACDTNAGSQVMVASVVAPPGIGQWVSFETEIQIESASSAFPDWWRIRNQFGQTGQCRGGALSVSADFNGWTGCTDAYAGQAAGGVTTYLVGFGAANRARLAITWSVPPAAQHPLIEGVEYYTARVEISNTKTVGDGACAGCTAPMCIQCSYVRCLQPAGSPNGNVTVTALAFGSYVSWQGGEDVGCGGYRACTAPNPAKGSNPCTIACPVQRSTWGQLKALYR